MSRWKCKSRCPTHSLKQKLTPKRESFTWTLCQNTNTMKDGLVCIPPLAGEVMWGGGVGEIADGGGFVFLPLSRRECQDDEYAEWVGDIQRVPTQKTKKIPKIPHSIDPHT
ncbi:MAG TPA: hypothetical protein DCE42_06410 [Myxococcales bacterium]|nr:hypothetical protein [Myxococcales bacterium]